MATLESKTILIFGGSSGIGYSVAEASLASRAALVSIASSSASKVSDAVKRLESANVGSGKVKGEVVNVTDAAAVKAFLARVGEVDHLVFTSGDALKPGFPLEDLDDSVKRLFDVRFWAPVLISQTVKIRPGGSITLTTGSSLVKPPKGCSIVAGWVGATDALTRGLAVDLAPIRVNSICPGLVDTEFWGERSPMLDKIFKEVADKLLVDHIGGPAEIAEAYLFVMKCAYITGQSIEVDGGYVLGA